MNPDRTTHATFGQRIDALIEPLNAQAEQHRATLYQARAQIQQVKQQIDHSEQALRDIEKQMVTVLHALAVEEPMLAKAMGTHLPPVSSPQVATLAGAPLVVPKATPSRHVPIAAENDANVAEIVDILSDTPAEGQASPHAFPAAAVAIAPATEQLSAEDALARDKMLAIIETGALPSEDGITTPSLEAAVQHAADVALELEQPQAPLAE